MTPLKAVLALFRKDAGLYGDVQRASQLAWMLFLKAIDERETEREILDERHRSPIPDRFRWGRWTAHTPHDELPLFIDRELFPALRALPAGKDPTTRGLAFAMPEDITARSSRRRSKGLRRSGWTTLPLGCCRPIRCVSPGLPP